MFCLFFYLTGPFCVRLYCIFSSACYEFGHQYQCNRLPGETQLRNDRLHVECDFELYSWTVLLELRRSGVMA